MQTKLVVVVGVAAMLAATGQAAAQGISPPNTWSRGTTLELFAGAAKAPPNTGTAVGAAVGWELNHFVELEGLGAWLAERRGASAFTAEFKGLVNLMQPARIVPYATAGLGMYRATFDKSAATLPHFYAQRLEISDAARTSFTDPSFVFGGGLNVYLARHVSVRPEVTLRLVTNGLDVYRVTMVDFSLAYHVEEHAVGGSRR